MATGYQLSSPGLPAPSGMDFDHSLFFIMEPFQSCFNVLVNDPRLLRVSRCQGERSDRHCLLEKYIVQKLGSCNRTRISASEVTPGKFLKPSKKDWPMCEPALGKKVSEMITLHIRALGNPICLS